MWGEWEAKSRVVRHGAPPGHICIPLRSTVSDAGWHDNLAAADASGKRHNTDPYLFGDRICYANCLQFREPYRAFLQSIEVGSVILFGEPVSGSTVFSLRLSAVLVVETIVDYSPRELVTAYREAVLTDNFIWFQDHWLARSFVEVSTLPLYYYHARYQAMRLKLYLGKRSGDAASPFSFFPCSDVPFSMPVIELGSGCLGNNSVRWIGDSIGYRDMSKQELQDAWERVRSQVVAADLMTGVYAEPPH